MSRQYYKESNIDWIGDIPEDWEIKKLKYLADINKRNLLGKTDSDYEIKYLDISNVTSTGEILTIQKMIFKNAPSRARRIPENFDTIISTVRTYLKAICFLEDIPKNLIVSTGFAVLHPKSMIISKFLYYFVRSQYFIETVMKNSVGVSYPAINASDLACIKCLQPPNDLQKDIIRFLNQKTTEIDSFIEKKKCMIKLLQEYRQSIINGAVTKGLDSDVEMKDSGIEWVGIIPKHWIPMRLKYFALINPRKNYSNFSKDSEDVVTFLPMEMVNEDGTYRTELKRKIKELWKGFTYFEENDVIVAKITPCFENKKGACLIDLEGKFGFGSTEFHVLREKADKSISKYIYYITKSSIFMHMGESLMRGAAGQKRVPTDFIKNFVVSAPPLEEQRKIVKYLDQKISEIDSIILNIKKQINKLNDYRQSIISEATSGKIDVRNFKIKNNY